MAFDPAEDDAQTGSQIHVRDVYQGLLNDGYEDEADELREIDVPPRQNRRAIQLKKEHLVETNEDESEREYTRSLTMDPEKRREETRAFVEEHEERRKSLQGFDPAEDAPRNSRKVRIHTTYQELLEGGHEDEATTLRETKTAVAQDQLAKQYREEILNQSRMHNTSAA